MGNNCMVCGDELKVMECSGEIKGMNVSFCDLHAEYCDNCETVKCKTIEKNQS